MIDAVEIRGPAEAETHSIQSDHRALAAAAARLEALLGASAAGVASAPSEVRALLEEFRRLLVAHLGAEERSGVLERAAIAEPRFAQRIGQLLVEHDELRRRVAALAVGPEGEGWVGFRARFIEFRSLLDLHEQAENDILHRTYFEDLGGRG